MTRPVGRRKRRELLGGIGLAALGIVVLVLALIALRSPNGRGTVTNHDTATTSSVAKTPSSGSRAAPSRMPSSATAGRAPLVVLNGSSRVGLAQQAAARFEAGGWTVASTGNLTGDIPSTCAYYDPAVPGAEAAGRALRAQFPTIKRVARKLAGLPAGPVVVVLRADYS